MSTNSESRVEYTPSTEEVREEYWLASGDPSRDSKAKREFDRWLADHERAVAAAALLSASEEVAGFGTRLHADHASFDTGATHRARAYEQAAGHLRRTANALISGEKSVN